MHAAASRLRDVLSPIAGTPFEANGPGDLREAPDALTTKLLGRLRAGIAEVHADVRAFELEVDQLQAELGAEPLSQEARELLTECRARVNALAAGFLAPDGPLPLPEPAAELCASVAAFFRDGEADGSW